MHYALRGQALLAITLLTSFIAFVLAQIETVSIRPTYPHDCVNKCVYEPDWQMTTAIEDILGCGSPVANNCYCATASASASAVESWISACAATRCGKGDISDDRNAMRSIYASYCLQAGFTAPIISTWYSPATTTASSPKDTSGAITTTPTATQVTVVTQTAPPSNSASSMQGKFLPLTLMLALSLAILQVVSPLSSSNFLEIDWKTSLSNTLWQ
jgi:hypothetical protein